MNWQLQMAAKAVVVGGTLCVTDTKLSNWLVDLVHHEF